MCARADAGRTGGAGIPSPMPARQYRWQQRPKHGAGLFSNGAVTSGVLRTEQTLSDQTYERLKKIFERHTGQQCSPPDDR